MASPEGAEISVWVCQEEKVVCGLTKRTSCAQVVRALLKDHLANAGDARLLHAPPRDYCIVEKWRGFERFLPPPTKLLRLWASWGEEQPNVHFVLVKWGASLPVPGLRAAEAKVVQNTEGQRDLSPAQYIKNLPADKQKRMVRKAFKKLARMKKLRQGREGIETLVHLIVSQDHTIRQQLQRMKELDEGIDRFESRLHLERIQNEGENYVQETYLLESGESGRLACGSARLQEYLNRREEVLQLEVDVQQRRETIEKLNQDIERELWRAWGVSAQEKGQSDPQPLCQDQQSWRAEAERVHSELERGMCNAFQLRKNLLDVQEKVEQQEALLSEKTEEWDRLVQQLESLNLTEEAESEAPLTGVCKDLAQCSLPRNTVKNPCGSRSASLSPSDVNDTDSDTGISSTHSQDSEPPCVEVFSTSQNYL
ncbi:ras association domain-containing protein 9-like [Carcharodon carcharias]|uniref:ras association domain-containing protein 9-like n=1 Tax=Carcharodon carcharias TaxID=13397 RepID=UPI001B7EA12A|nr:ras association domain-containing protein 9-like [Carcharodon carcharias]